MVLFIVIVHIFSIGSWGGGGGGGGDHYCPLLRLGVMSFNYHKFRCTIYIIILDPDERPTTMRSNDTLVDTPFQLISDFFHV